MKKIICFIFSTCFMFSVFAKNIDGFFGIKFGSTMTDTNIALQKQGYFVGNLNKPTDSLFIAMYLNEKNPYFLNSEIKMMNAFFDSYRNLCAFQIFFAFNDQKSYKAFIASLFQEYPDLNIKNIDNSGSSEQIDFKDSVTGNYLTTLQNKEGGEYIISITFTDKFIYEN